jgi:hypothetical protein
MSNETNLLQLQQQIEGLRDEVDELRARCATLEQHVIRSVATIRVVVELVKGQ